MLESDLDIWGKEQKPIMLPIVEIEAITHLLKVVPVDVEKPILLCLLLGEADNFDDYLCIEISDSRLDAFMIDGVDLRSLFEKPEKQEYFLAEGIDTNSEAELKGYGPSVPDKWLPLSGYYYSEGYPESDFEITKL